MEKDIVMKCSDANTSSSIRALMESHIPETIKPTLYPGATTKQIGNLYRQGKITLDQVVNRTNCGMKGIFMKPSSLWIK